MRKGTIKSSVQYCIAAIVETLQGRSLFFWRRCPAGFPWSWPARPLGHPAMVEARTMVRRHFARDHHPVHRTLARGLVTLAWPPAVLLHLFKARHRFEDAILKRVPGTLWAAIRYNVLPDEYYVYGLWQPDRSRNIDNYLY